MQNAYACIHIQQYTSVHLYIVYNNSVLYSTSYSDSLMVLKLISKNLSTRSYQQRQRKSNQTVVNQCATYVLNGDMRR